MTGRYPVLRHRVLRLSAWRRPLVAGPGQTLVSTLDAAGRATAVTLVDIRPDVDVCAEWELAAADSAARFPVRVTFRCTVVDAAAVVRGRRAGSWDPAYVLAQDLRPFRLHGEHLEADADGLRRALTALLSSAPAHREIPGIRVELGHVGVGDAWSNEVDEA